MKICFLVTLLFIFSDSVYAKTDDVFYCTSDAYTQISIKEKSLLRNKGDNSFNPTNFKMMIGIDSVSTIQNTKYGKHKEVFKIINKKSRSDVNIIVSSRIDGYGYGTMLTLFLNQNSDKFEFGYATIENHSRNTVWGYKGNCDKF